MTLSHAKKYGKFLRGDYKFPPPPMSHAYWSNQQWIEYIDIYGVWL